MSPAIRDANRFGALTEERIAAFEPELGATLSEGPLHADLLFERGVT
jgi:hypothetical protein